MEQTSRNTARTANRNEGALKSLNERVPFEAHGFFYQYCNNNKCRQITTLVKPLPREATTRELDAFTKVVAQAKIPGAILQYPEQDHIEAIKIAPDGTVQTKGASWEQYIYYLHQLQVEHETQSGLAECARYEHKPLNKGRWSSPDEDTKFSNEVRSVPGVRHIDTDGAYHCPDCLALLLLVEASSDGCPGTPMAGKFKATTMTRKVASATDAVPLLIQHHYADDNHEHPVYLTSWASGSQKRFDRTWDTLVQDFERYYERHKPDCPAQNA